MSTSPHDTASMPLWDRIHQSFLRQGMMPQLGARLDRVAPGEVDIALPYSDRVTQQQGGFHGGAMGALADIAGGYAALTVTPEGMEVTTVEYKINFLAAFQGGELRATGKVLRRQATDRDLGARATCFGIRQDIGLRRDAANRDAGSQNLRLNPI